MTTVTIPSRSSAPSAVATGARAQTVAGVSAGAFLAILGLLHILKPELSPTWRMVSEYQIGRHGWLMSVAFVLLAAACLATARTVVPVAADRAGRVGRIALRLSAAGLTLAAVATADPVTATPEQLTTHGNLHGLGAMVGIPAFLVAAIAVNRSVQRSQRAPQLRAATVAVVTALIVFAVSMAVMFDGAPATPDVRLGIQNRALVVTYAAWLIVAARAAVVTNRTR